MIKRRDGAQSVRFGRRSAMRASTVIFAVERISANAFEPRTPGGKVLTK